MEDEKATRQGISKQHVLWLLELASYLNSLLSLNFYTYLFCHFGFRGESILE